MISEETRRGLEDAVVNQATYRSEVAAQATDLFHQMPETLSRPLLTRLRFGVEQEQKHDGKPGGGTDNLKLLSETLPTFLTLVQTAIKEGWLDELVGRMEREAS